MSNRISGYDPDTGICWRFRNKGDNYLRHKCPGCSAGRSPFIMFGRCRSGRRWFWQAYNSTHSAVRFYQTDVWIKIEEHGFEDTEEAAWTSACAAVVRMDGGQPAIAAAVHGCASEELKELNATKRAARPTPDTSNAKSVEFLYSPWYATKTYPITKKTPKRIYYWDDYYKRVGFVSRQKCEAGGYSWIQTNPPKFDGQCKSPNLHALKAEMAAAHPDRGGSNAAFIEARARYVAARRQLRSQRHS